MIMIAVLLGILTGWAAGVAAGFSPLPDEVAPLLNKVSSQEIILIILVLFVSASLFVVSLRFTFKLLVRRDEVISELAGEIGKLSLCLTKVIEVQG
jgi:hypothetical protein